MRLGGLFSSSTLPYPGATTDASRGSCGGAAPQSTGFFNRFFAPDDLPYPIPGPSFSGGGHTAGGSGSTPPTAPTPPGDASNGAASAGAAAPVCAGQVTINIAAPATTATGPTTSTPSTPTTTPTSSAASPVASPTAQPIVAASTAPVSAMPVNGCPATAPAQTLVRAYGANPRLRARNPRAHEVYLEEVLEENVSARMLTKDSAPVAFVVPDGFNAVEFMTGPVELDPVHGKATDLDEVVTVGELKSTVVPPLKAGDQVSVVVPWRYASWVELSADHLRLPIYARFFVIENA